MNEIKVLGYPNVGRYGLAHSLLAWARCVVWCKINKVEMISPNWNKIRIGPYLRREQDKREYHRLFKFKNYITGIRRWFVLLTYKKIDANEIGVHSNRSQNLLVEFKNDYVDNFNLYFDYVIDHHLQIKNSLLQITKPEYIPKIGKDAFVAIHVRRGDFSKATDNQKIKDGAFNVQLPLGWYALTLEKIRSATEMDVKAIVFSDGSPEELADLLNIKNVFLSPSVSAVTDLLHISSASYLISSASGFSLWGSYLGQVPRFCYPGQRVFRVLKSSTQIDLEYELPDDAAIPPELVSLLRHRIGV